MKKGKNDQKLFIGLFFRGKLKETGLKYLELSNRMCRCC
jgi:hypothetical protein